MTDADETRAQSAAARAAQTIGPYRLLEPIGEGGMGEVWLAEQARPVRRKVALKIIKAGMNTAQVVARFEAERQALALMDHPAIARVFEAGATAEGRPYFAMEYVRGESITTYCARHKVTLRERIDLFLQVCDGVQHAHQKGVIHRDLKPSNILVTLQDDRPVPKIIDFGVAKATTQPLTDRTLHTELAPSSARPVLSPEQAEMGGLDVDTRTDVYSLGAVLYELLTGVMLFDWQTLRSKSLDELRRTIREVEPPRPSTRVTTAAGTPPPDRPATRIAPAMLASELKGDLDWITMKALEKDRTRRYGSASDLAADLRRHLENQPALAGPPSTIYRVGKFVRRNRGGVAAAAVLVVRCRLRRDHGDPGAPAEGRTRSRQPRAGVGRGVERLPAPRRPGAGGAREPGRARRETGRRHQGPHGARPRRRSHRRQVRRAAAGRSRDPGDHRFDLRLAGPLRSGAAATPALARDRGRRREGPRHAARATRSRGWTRRPATPPRLCAVFGLASDLQTQLRPQQLPGHPDDEKCSWNQYLQARTTGRKGLVEGIPLARSLFGSDDDLTQRSITNLGSLYLARGAWKEAEPLLTESLAVNRRVRGPEHQMTIRTMDRLAQVFGQQGRYKEAEVIRREVLAVRLRQVGPEHPGVSVARASLAQNLINQNDQPDCRKQSSAENLELSRRLNGEQDKATSTARVSPSISTTRNTDTPTPKWCSATRSAAFATRRAHSTRVR